MASLGQSELKDKLSPPRDINGKSIYMESTEQLTRYLRVKKIHVWLNRDYCEASGDAYKEWIIQQDNLECIKANYNEIRQCLNSLANILDPPGNIR